MFNLTNLVDVSQQLSHNLASTSAENFQVCANCEQFFVTAYEKVLKARCFARRGVKLQWRFNRWITRCISKAVSGCLQYDLITRVFISGQQANDFQGGQQWVSQTVRFS